MTKRILAMLMVAAMVLSVLPAGVFAEGKAYEPLAAHDSAAHICEHCATTATWTAWGDDEAEKTKLPDSNGHYYLVNDIKMSTQAAYSSTDVTICLNGHDIIGNNSGYNIFRMDGTAKVTIVDCTAKTENGVYTAGKITAYSGKIAVMMVSTNTGAIFTMYDGIITGCKNASGCAANIQGKGTMNVYGGEISGNTGGGSGTIYAYGANTTLNIENAVIKDNTATGNGGVVNCTNGKVTIKNSQVTGNTAAAGAVAYMKNGTLTLDGAQITGNRTVSTYGAIYAFNDGGTASIVLKGETVVTGNTFGDETSKTERNLYIRDHWFTISPKELSGNAKVGLFVETSRINQTNGKQYLTPDLGGVDVTPFFTSDKAEYIPALAANGRLILVVKPAAPEHPHRICNDAACADGHGELEFGKWTDSTSLPTSGSWYLDTDVKLTKRTEVTTGELNLCLNGHKVEAASNVYLFYLNGTCNVNVTDCTAKTADGVYTAGSLDAYDGSIAIYTHRNSTAAQFSLYEGIITGCKGTSGCAINLQGKGIFNMYGGEISGNAGGGSGAIYMANDAKANLYGGSVKNNTAGNGIFYLTGANTALTVEGATISGNTTTGAGGAIYVKGGTVNLNGCTITGNKAGSNGGAVYAAAGTKLTLSGNVNITGNTVKDAANNVYLEDDVRMTLGTLGDNAKVGVGAASAFRAISEQTDTDASAKFISDKASLQVVYKDKALYLDAVSGHTHCLCLTQIPTGCDHRGISFAAWDDPASLPASGSYYLTVDVTLSATRELRNKNLTLCLNGHTIKMEAGGKKIPVFDVKNATTLNITDCNETAGTVTGGTNGAINCNNNASAKVSLYRGNLTGNSGDMAGAVMLQTSSVFNMYGGKITDNTHAAALVLDANGEPALDDSGNPKYTGATGGGAVVAYYGTTQFNMYGGEISGNKSTAVNYKKNGEDVTVGGNGGAIYSEGNSVTVNLYGGQIKNNSADRIGGAVYATKGTTLKLLGTKLTGNRAGNTAGAVFITGAGSLTLDGSELSGNKANNGGAILVESRSHMDFLSGKVTGNEAADGGGIYITTNTSFNMTGGEISGNTATGNGGGLALLRCEANITGGTISGNTAKYGGGMLVRGAQLTLKDVQIVKNTATANGGGIKTGNQNAGEQVYSAKITMQSGAVINHNTARIGGGVILEGAGCELTMTGGEISNNKASTDAGGIYVSTKTVFTMEDGKLSSNTANNGGAMVMLNSTGTFTGGEISGNTAKSKGGAIYVTNEKAAATFQGTAFTKNKGAYGGAVLVANRAVATIKSGKFSNNTAVNNGGGLYISTNSTLNMYGGSVSSNTVEKDTGGGLYGLRSTMNLYGGTVSYNTSKVGGGGIMAAGATLNLKGADVLYNTAISASGTGGTGGGVRTNTQTVKSNGVSTQYPAKIVMTAGSIKGNEAGYGGGGVLVNGYGAQMEMSGGTVSDNSSGLGGGLYVSNQTTLTVTGGELCRNEASSEGGAVWFAKKTSHTISNASISENTSGKNAGAVYFHNDAKCTFTDVTFSKNTATASGGAIFGQPGGNPVLIRCTFTENQTLEASGGAVFSRFNATMEDCVFVGNKSGSNAGAIYMGQSSLSVNGWGSQTSEDVGVFIKNCTFENNTAVGKGGAAYLMMSAFTDIQATTFTGNTSGAEGSAIWAEENLTMTDVTVQGNTAENGGHAVYLADSEYDGESYFKGLMIMAGDMIIKDNQGGDLYLGVKTTVGTTAQGFGKNTYMVVTLDSGYLTQRIYGSYDYEVGNCVYTLTYGDRSLTEPEFVAEPEQTETVNTGDVMLYVGIGAFVVAVAAIVLLLVRRKKKEAQGAENK